MSKFKHRIERLEKKTGETKAHGGLISVIQMRRAVKVFDKKGIDISEGPALSLRDLRESFKQWKKQDQDPAAGPQDPRDMTDGELAAEIEKELGGTP